MGSPGKSSRIGPSAYFGSNVNLKLVLFCTKSDMLSIKDMQIILGHLVCRQVGTANNLIVFWSMPNVRFKYFYAVKNETI